MPAAAPRPGVLVVGDVNPDLILRGDVVPRFGQAEQLLTDAILTIGGSGAIAAHALARLGRPVALVAAVGDDAFGSRILVDLAAAGVQVDAVTVRAGLPTGLTVVLSEERDRAILTLPGAVASLTLTEAESALDGALASGATHLHVASPFLLIELLPDLPELLRTARNQGFTISLDPNDAPHGEWRRLDECLPLLDVLLPNAGEATALAGRSDPRRAGEVLAARGPLVVVKDGAAGAFACERGGPRVAVTAEAVEPVDATGAGDTFDAAFLDSWLDGRDLAGCLRRAVLAGAFNVRAVGGTAGQPDRSQLADP